MKVELRVNLFNCNREKEGIDSILAKDFEKKATRDEMINALKNYLSAENDWEEISSDIKTLVEGGDIFSMDIDAMEEAIERINIKYKEIFNKELRLKETFQE